MKSRRYRCRSSRVIRCLVVTIALMAGPTTAFGQGYVCAEGGGNPNNGDWVPAVFGWMVEKGNFGDVVILGISGSDSAAAAAFTSNGAASVTHLNVTASNANSQSTYDTISSADIVWLRGGDQANYVNLWNGTLTEQAIRDVYLGGGVVGGTSAGCAVMGDVIFDAVAGSLTPRQALNDPYHPFLTLTDDFLNLTPGVLFDSHFTERGRLGRLVIMLGRYFEDTGDDILAIGVDDRTALCVSPDMTAEVLGEAAVTVLHRTDETLQLLAPGEPPVITNVRHTQMTEGYRYDLINREVIERPSHATMIDPPTTHPDFHFTSLSGSALNDRQKGEVWVDDGGSSWALFDGELEIKTGNGLLQQTVLNTQVWASSSFVENRVGGVQYALAHHPHMLGLYLDTGVNIDVRIPALLRINESTSTFNNASTLILDGYGMTSRAFSTYSSSQNFAVGPRQSVAIENATLHAIRPGKIYSGLVHDLVHPADFNGDGVVNVADLLMLLAEWGPCPNVDDCPADLTASGVVNVADLLVLLSAWG